MSNPWDSIVGTSEYNENNKRIEELAVSHGYMINSDKERVKKVVGLMTMNFNEFDKYYCPCKQNHPLNEAKDAICPCPELDEEIKKDGNCFCRLFYRK
ncbi:MAG: ferredoxin-thioredoxin reductase catalytic domain-containing protein [bacterium]